MKVALWGCGKAGRDTYRLIEEGAINYEVIAFGDKRSSLLNKNKDNDDIIFKFGKILGFYEVKKLYEAKKIDGVIICIFDKNQYNAVQSQFEVMGVPIYKISNNVSVFDISKNTYKIFSNMLKVAVLNDADIEVNAIPVAYTYIIKNNRVLWESDRFFTHSKFNFLYPFVYPIKEYDLEFDKICSLLFLGTNNVYGHFIFACLNKIYAMEEAGFNGKYLIYDSPFARKWMELAEQVLNIAENRIIYINSKSICRIRANEIHIAENIVDAGELNAKILHKFSRKILNFIHKNNENINIKFPEFLYVKRNENYQRKVLAETEEIIKSYGFVTILPETLPIETQIEYFYNAKVIIAPHGSNVANMIFMQKDSHLLELFDYSFVDLFYVECAKEIGVKFNMLVSHNEYNLPTQNECFIHPTLLKTTIENINFSISKINIKIR